MGNDEECIEFPFPYDLVNLNSRYISKVSVQKNIYEYDGKKFYFIRCEMEIREFVKGLYKFLSEPEEEEFEIFMYFDWEDEIEEHSFRPVNGGAYSYLDSKVAYGKYKKMMLMGDSISDSCNLNLFADKNKEGKDIVYIQVDMDVEVIEDEYPYATGSLLKRLVEKRMREVYEMRVYEVIQINKEYLATHKSTFIL